MAGNGVAAAFDKAKPTIIDALSPAADVKPDRDNKRKSNGIAHFGVLILLFTTGDTLDLTDYGTGISLYFG